MVVKERTFERVKDALAIATVLATFIIVFVNFKFCIIPSSSMVPAFQVGDIAVAKYTDRVKSGDVIIFYPFEDQKEMYIKRLIGLPGDTIAIYDGLVYRNGVALDEPYLNDGTTNGEMEEFTVPEGKMFCLGDNRLHSADSRVYGCFPLDQLIGKVFFRM